MKINSNIGALQAARSMNRSNDKVTKSLERLSSGYKINTVADNPTGVAVSSRMKAQLYGLKRASANSSDGISMVQTAEGAMQETHEMLKRMRELAVQSANDTNTAEDRQKMQLEADQLIEAIDEISEVTEFNKMKLLNGTLSNQTTISQGNQISYDISTEYMSPNFPIGEYQIDVSGFDDPVVEIFSGSLTAGVDGSITINRDTVEIPAGATLEDIQNKLTEIADLYDCVVEFSGSSFELLSKEAGARPDLEIEIENCGTISRTNTGKDANVTLVNGFSPSAVVATEGNRIFITESDGTQLQLDLAKVGVNGAFDIDIVDKGQLKLQTGANEEQRINLMIPGVSSKTLGLSKTDFSDPTKNSATVNLINLKNCYDSEESIERLDKAISKVSDMRASLGAYQNRLEHTVKSLDINDVNTAEALSRIQDTDMALEMSSYTLNNVVMQSAISMLSQANERPQQLLQILR